jgi:methionine biosynthesis protein MetW
MVGEGARVLDLGCGDGALLEQLIKRQGCSGLGVELDDDDFHGCIARGVPVTHGDLEVELPLIEDDAFDVAVLSLTLQAIQRPDQVLSEMQRVAGGLIVSFRNYGHWRMRAALALRGRSPVVDAPHSHWYDTPRIHACTIADFEQLADDLDLKVKQRIVTDETGQRAGALARRAANLLAWEAIYWLEG